MRPLVLATAAGAPTGRGSVKSPFSPLSETGRVEGPDLRLLRPPAVRPESSEVAAAKIVTIDDKSRVSVAGSAKALGFVPGPLYLVRSVDKTVLVFDSEPAGRHWCGALDEQYRMSLEPAALYHLGVGRGDRIVVAARRSCLQLIAAKDLLRFLPEPEEEAS